MNFAQSAWERVCFIGDRLPSVELVHNPYLSVPTLLLDALGGWSRGVNPQLREDVRRGATGQDYAALAPMAVPGRSRQPDCIIAPLPTNRDVTMAEALERVHDIGGDELLANFAEMFPERVPVEWRAAERHPRQWITAYAHAATLAGRVVERRWHALQSSLDREARRVGTAIVRGAFWELLASLHPRAQVAQGGLLLPAIEANEYQVSARRLILVPIVSGSLSIAHDLDQPDTVWLGYPLPGIASLAWTGSGLPCRDQLGMLLGLGRAQILRRLGRMMTVSEVARALGWQPSSVTRHSSWLESAGLVERVRCGKAVGLHRTRRGDELLDLYTGE